MLKKERISSKEEAAKESSKKKDRTRPERVTPDSGRRNGRISTSPRGSIKSTSATEDNISFSQKSHSLAAQESAKHNTQPRTARSSAWDSPSHTSHAQKQDSIKIRTTYSEQESPSGHGSGSDRRENRKSQKGKILSQVFEESRKTFAKPQAIPMETPRVPSVEAWLNNTPDPFIDGEEPLTEEASSQPIRAKTPSPAPKVPSVPTQIKYGIRWSRRIERGQVFMQAEDVNGSPALLSMRIIHSRQNLNPPLRYIHRLPDRHLRRNWLI